MATPTASGTIYAHSPEHPKRSRSSRCVVRGCVTRSCLFVAPVGVSQNLSDANSSAFDSTLAFSRLEGPRFFKVRHLSDDEGNRAS
jgi:hypothetical protein